MELRIIEYFLAVVREGNISAAAQTLHISQPALSRQLKDLEEELGVTLFERGNRRIVLSEEGMILRKRAEEIIRLVHQTEKEVTEVRNSVSGDVYIGAGESSAFHYVSRAAGNIRRLYPDIRFHIISGDTRDLMDLLSRGLVDFALIFNDYDHSLYPGTELPQKDVFGILMRKDAPLAEKKEISAADLEGIPLTVSRASLPFLDSWNLQIAGTYNLVFNASLLAEDAGGYALAFDQLVHTGKDSALCFRPLTPEISVRGTVIWKKYQVFSPASELFIQQLKTVISEEEAA